MLKAKIKKELENEGQKGKILRLQRKVQQQKKLLDKTQLYKIQRDEAYKKAQKYKSLLEAQNALAQRYKNERNTYQIQLESLIKQNKQVGNINLISNNGAFNIYNANQQLQTIE